MIDTLTIGEHQLPVTVPADIDDRLIAAIGWGVAELPQLLNRSTVALLARIASLVVAGDDAPAPDAIATLIEDADSHVDVRAQLLTLLANPPAADTAAHPSED
ncbi:hypothetical protein [Sphingomonas aquatilis]|uniref:hypothetical protein n=1 Tax=Sphingomonas aquatilis TaxID=93063 RepID=UPI0023F86318|nr:hypothetical protein [Sphingomonas aquatilis]MCI4653126.1 hypothetical protein [Sphingomonas aquatilis]